MDRAFCILSAGRGSRLGDLTSSINKALLPVDNKASISHIIEKIPQDCEIVIAVGYDKEKVKEYCLAAHPERPFVFIEVDKLEGPGSGPGYSLLCCKEHLQRPFYLCNADTLINEEEYLCLDQNWIGCAPTDKPELFATVEITLDVLSWRVSHFCDKSREGGAEAYIGLMGIKDYGTFWESLEKTIRQAPEQQYVAALTDECLARLRPLAVQYDWFDTGSLEGYEETCRAFEGDEILGLPKNISEITYKANGRLIKLCLESAKNSRRLARADQLRYVVPPIVYRGRYVMAYEWVEGHTLYADGCDLGHLEGFLEFCHGEHWEDAVDLPKDWYQTCHSFYCDKTWDRLNDYLTSRRVEHSTGCHINGHYCHPTEAYLTFLPWEKLSIGAPVVFHGDLQFDNALLGEDGRWYWIDWRDCFGDSLEHGDFYYELGKLYSGLELPYDVLKRGEFSFEKHEDKIRYNYQIDNKLMLFRESFENWIIKNEYDLKKVKIIAALVYINMAPLHPGSLGDLLFYHGTLKLDLLNDTLP